MTMVKGEATTTPRAGGGAAASPVTIDGLPAAADAGRAKAIENEKGLQALLKGLPFAGEPSLDVLGIDHVNLSVRRVDRSIGFYSRVFGFRVVEDARHRPHPYVIMTANGCAYLALHEDFELTNEPASGARRSPWHWSFVVGDIERARAALWDLGVPVSVPSDDPDQVHRWKTSRSLYVDDPDGHRIELVEVWGGGLSHS